MGFLTVTIAIIATSILVPCGLQGTAAEVNDSWEHTLFNILREAERLQVMSLMINQHSMRNPRAVLL